MSDKPIRLACALPKGNPKSDSYVRRKPLVDSLAGHDRPECQKAHEKTQEDQITRFGAGTAHLAGPPRMQGIEDYVDLRPDGPGRGVDAQVGRKDHLQAGLIAELYQRAVRLLVSGVDPNHRPDCAPASACQYEIAVQEL